MTDQSWWAYALMFVVPIALTTVFTPIAMNIAQRLGILDHPGPAKVHKSPVPYLGGAAIVIAFSLIVLVASLLNPRIEGGLPDLTIFLGMAVGLALVGLVDDIRSLSPWLRLALEVGAGFGVWATGTGIRLPLPEPLGAIATMAWVVVVTNAFNLLDNMDGLSAGVAAISSIFLFIVAITGGRFLVAGLALAIGGCGIGFLRHNFHPARIYMGDAGSLFIGFVLAVITLKLRTRTGINIFVPTLILGIPLFDTTLVMITRVLHRRSPFRGGKDHVSHRLVFVGVPVWASVSLIYAGAIGFGWLAIVMERVGAGTSLILMGLVVGVALFLGVILAMVPVYGRDRRGRPGRPATRLGAVGAPDLSVADSELVTAGAGSEAEAASPWGELSKVPVLVHEAQASDPRSHPDRPSEQSRWRPADSLRQLLGEDFFVPDPGRWRLSRSGRDRDPTGHPGSCGAAFDSSIELGAEAEKTGPPGKANGHGNGSGNGNGHARNGGNGRLGRGEVSEDQGLRGLSSSPIER